MKNALLRILLVASCIVLTMSAAAEVVRLKSGAKVVGTIVFQNEEVVVVKDASGARFQYMMTDVDSIVEKEEEAKKIEAEEVARVKKATVGIELSGGLGVLPPQYISTVATSTPRLAGDVQADLVIGSANLMDRNIILGGSVGYHFVSLGGPSYSFLPLQLKMSVPFSTNTNAPMVSASVGYGFALNKELKGGICASLAFGWRRQMSRGRALFVGAYANFQQAQGMVEQNLDGFIYTGKASCSSVGTGVRLGVFL